MLQDVGAAAWLVSEPSVGPWTDTAGRLQSNDRQFVVELQEEVEQVRHAFAVAVQRDDQKATVRRNVVPNVLQPTAVDTFLNVSHFSSA
ncbi:MAG: hypothetical protein LW835_17165 [Burkholderiaceae bacterium]|jgi:hypothetical protein|nr:hypothetical protein [Burkholderiaceae bacterium]